MSDTEKEEEGKEEEEDKEETKPAKKKNNLKWTLLLTTQQPKVNSVRRTMLNKAGLHTHHSRIIEGKQVFSPSE